jgi:hypothetical protein
LVVGVGVSTLPGWRVGRGVTGGASPSHHSLPHLSSQLSAE